MAFDTARDQIQERRVHFSFVWIHMLEGDSAVSASAASMSYPNLHNIAHFHDPDRAIGARIAASIGAAGRTAWDFYLVYDKAQEWGDSPPPPVAWFHQLRDDAWAGPAHFRWGQDLGPALREVLDKTLGFRAA